MNRSFSIVSCAARHAASKPEEESRASKSESQSAVANIVRKATSPDSIASSISDGVGITFSAQNVTVHRAAANDIDFRIRAAAASVCNGWLSVVNLGGRWNASLRSKARPSKPMVTGDCSRKPSGRSVVEQRMSPEHADGRCEEARASHQEIGRSNQKSCPREWFVGYIVHRHQPQASVVTPRPNTSIPIVVDRITSPFTGPRQTTLI
ncbi:hypothetical protein CA13_00150 [Planctomycetes bacterium CA13]|uniref:Uncharacterized protein n=1 Tax=Novipirellula herctigrandis TaxID=2527986 RepID=A0A5C5YUC5_9BACT|nr:hypothetical protein CA13_00150 [Planctomycetes bacterium CA13]